MRYPNQAGTLAALDSAVHDWIGNRLGLPVHRFLGTKAPVRKQTALTLRITTPEEAEAAARSAVSHGYSIIKLKVGLPTLEEDFALTAAARAGAPDALLLLDANGGWNPQDAPQRIATLAALRPALVEQPVGPGQIDELRRISNQSPVPIFADDDALTPLDVPYLWGAIAGINVKLNKCGGIRQALAMIHAAKAGGLQIMLGCMVQSSLGLAPAVHLASLAD
jgi:L-alanine-DL-glutamate epimerase-like enolase superfamily enzyme